MNNCHSRLIMLSMIYSFIFSISLSKEKVFILKADGKTKTLQDSCKEMSKFYKRKVVCRSSEDFLGDYYFPLDITATSFEQAVCELSKQLDCGFVNFFNGVMFSDDEFPISDYRIVNDSIFYFKGPFESGVERKLDSRIFQLGVYNLNNKLKDISLINVELRNKKGLVKLIQKGISIGNKESSKYFSVSKKDIKSGVDLSFMVDSYSIIDEKVYELVLKSGSSLRKDGLEINVGSVSRSKGIEFDYSLTWVSGMKKNEIKREISIMKKLKKTMKMHSKEDLKWLKALANRKDIKSMEITSIVLVNNEIEFTQFSGSKFSGFATGITGKSFFKSINKPVKIRLKVGRKVFSKRKIIFKSLNLIGK